MPDIGPAELMIILVIVLLLFGVGRIGKVAGELGQGIREFRKGLSSDEQVDNTKKNEPQVVVEPVEKK